MAFGDTVQYDQTPPKVPFVAGKSRLATSFPAATKPAPATVDVLSGKHITRWRTAMVARFAPYFVAIAFVAAVSGVAGYLVRPATVVASPPRVVVISAASDDQPIDQGSCAFRSGTKGC